MLLWHFLIHEKFCVYITDQLNVSQQDVGIAFDADVSGVYFSNRGFRSGAVPVPSLPLSNAPKRN